MEETTKAIEAMATSMPANFFCFLVNMILVLSAWSLVLSD